MNDTRVREAAREVLAGHWREGVTRFGMPYAFTVPSVPRYRHLWHWDSCFHAIAWRHFDVARARAELRTVLRTGDGTGFLPHTAFLDAPAGWRRAPLYATERPSGDWRTRSIGPPILPLAWEIVAAASDDEPAFATEALDELERHMDWLWSNRDPDGDGLLTILLPDESGCDDSPVYDPVYGPLAHHLPGYFWLVQRCRRSAFDAASYRARHDEHVADLLVTTLYALSCDALGRLGGDPRWGERARRIERALLERCWDGEAGLFWPLAGHHERPVKVSTWLSLAPIVLPGIPEDIRRRVVEEHVLHPRRYGVPCGIPSVSMDEPSFRAGFDRFRCWRGPSWINTAWLLLPAVRAAGHEAAAARIARSLVQAVEHHGFREYYHPYSGAGLAARDFGWSTLVVDLT